MQMDRARTELGYEPVQYSKQEVVEWYKARGYGALPQDPVLVARRRARSIRVAMALALVAWIILAWRSASLKRAAEEGAALLGEGHNSSPVMDDGLHEL
jgi:hypothetical protein